MHRANHTISRRRLGTLGIALVALVGTALGAHDASAAVACRSDPLVSFSNGITVDLHAEIGDTLADVQHVDYVLHGPALAGGSYSVSYPDGTGGISGFSYVGDGHPHQYYADITVTPARRPSR